MGERPTRTPLTRDQIVGFWAAWAGWTLDGMDSVIYALVLAPAGPVRPRTVAASATDAAPAPRRIRVCRDTLPMAQREDPSVLAPLLALAGKLTFRSFLLH